MSLTDFDTFHPAISPNYTQQFMRKTLLFQTLEAFAPEELVQFGEFLESPLFNGGTHARQNMALFTLISKNMRGGSEEFFDKNQICLQLSGTEGQPLSPHYLDNRMTDLLAAARKFITWQAMSHPPISEIIVPLAMVGFYRRKGQNKHWEQALNRAKNAAKTAPSSDRMLALMQYFVDKEWMEFSNLNNQRKGDLHIPQALESLTVFFGIELLEAALLLDQQERTVPGFSAVWKEMIKLIRQQFIAMSHFEKPALSMLEQALNLFESPTDNPLETISRFLEELTASEEKIPFAILQKLAAYARIYCNSHLKLAGSDMHRLSLRLYQQHLEKGWLHDHGKLLPSAFINLVNIGLALGEKEWVAMVLERYNTDLVEEHSDKAVQYCYARYHFACGDHGLAGELLVQLLMEKKFGDFHLEKLVRILQIKIAYEEGSSLLIDHLTNFKALLQRSRRRLIQDKFEANKNFLAMVQKLWNLRNDASAKGYRTKCQAHFSTLQSADYQVSEKAWLLDKCQLLLKKR